jgi:hypothetical protein
MDAELQGIEENGRSGMTTIQQQASAVLGYARENRRAVCTCDKQDNLAASHHQAGCRYRAFIEAAITLDEVANPANPTALTELKEEIGVLQRSRTRLNERIVAQESATYLAETQRDAAYKALDAVVEFALSIPTPHDAALTSLLLRHGVHERKEPV